MPQSPCWGALTQGPCPRTTIPSCPHATATVTATVTATATATRASSGGIGTVIADARTSTAISPASEDGTQRATSTTSGAARSASSSAGVSRANAAVVTETSTSSV